LSAVESGKLKILIEATDLLPIVDDVISTCQALAFKNGIILEHEKFSSDQIMLI
jgi:signal transduction histidine kinase